MRKLKTVIVKHENRIRQLEEISKEFELEKLKAAAKGADDKTREKVNDEKSAINDKGADADASLTSNPDLAPDEV